jgi:hypothetical protein
MPFGIIILVPLILVAIAGVLFLIACMASALEPLLWWAGWSRRSAVTLLPLSSSATNAPPEPDVDSYLVYLSGAGTMDPTMMEEKERQFIELLRSRLPRSIVITDVFPYSATNNPQLGERRLARLWRYAWRARNTRRRNFFQWLSVHAQQLRNSLQVAVSGDRRYGPILSYGVSQVIVAGLLRHGYRLGSDKPVILTALSGSGQISVGCVPILKRLLRRPIWIASIGGILTDDPGILETEHVYHLSGSLDNTQHMPRFFFPGVWPIFAQSAINRARREGRITVFDVGPMKHMRQGDYMSRSATLPNGQRYVDKTVDVLTEIVARIEVDAQAAMNRPEVATPDGWVSASRMGLGWRGLSEKTEGV